MSRGRDGEPGAWNVELTHEPVGSRSFGSALGFGYALGSLGGAAGATAAGFAYDATGTYLTSFATAAVMALVSLGCMWVLGRSLKSAPS